jgi:hypothetical protein
MLCRHIHRLSSVVYLDFSYRRSSIIFIKPYLSLVDALMPLGNELRQRELRSTNQSGLVAQSPFVYETIRFTFYPGTIDSGIKDIML